MKTTVLIVDDKADALRERLLADAEASAGLRLVTAQVRANGRMVKELGEMLSFARQNKYRFDFALIGLSLDESKGLDFAGYQLIRLIRRFYPKIRVVVYSCHDDVENLARAFRNGATWFIRKREIYRLPEILKSLQRGRKWRPEWKLIKKLGLVDFDFEQGKNTDEFRTRFNEKRKYLTYKCMESLPGKTIHLKPLGGGFSTAATFRAVKGRIIDGEPMQAPVIIKIDSRENTMMEYERYYRFVRPYIPNNSGRVEAPERVLDKNTAAIVYSYAGSNGRHREINDLRSIILEDMKKPESLDFEDYRSVFCQILVEILPKLHRISPEIEMDDDPMCSSFPNPDFWEVDSYFSFENWNNRINVKKDIELLYDSYPDCYDIIVELYDRICKLERRTKHPKRYIGRVGIVHGDVNLANVMIETRNGSVRGEDATAWLIDFAHTRRDTIDYDYCVMYTAVLGLWFRPGGRTDAHVKRLMKNFSEIVMRSVFARNDSLHSDTLDSDVEEDKRIAFIFRFLRWIRVAALEQGVTQELYAMSVVNALMVAFRIQAKFEKDKEAAKGMIYAALQVMGALEEYDENFSSDSEPDH